MGLTVRVSPKGLATEPNALEAGVRGYLRRAENVLCVRPGLLEPPFGVFRDTELNAASPGGTYRPRTLIPFDQASTDEVLVLSRDAGANYDWRWGIAGGVVGGAKRPPDEDYQDHKGLVARKSLYVTTSVGMRKLTSPTDTALDTPFAELGQTRLELSSAGSPVAIATGTAVAYRAIIKRTDANGYIIRSAPSPYHRLANGSGASRDAIVTVPIPSTVVAGDTIELYRARASTGATSIPSDELFLAQSAVVTSTDVSNGYVTITDALISDMLGAPLYTNASQDGIARANEPPPLAQDVALFGGCAWFANLLGRYTVDCTLRDIFSTHTLPLASTVTGMRYVKSQAGDGVNVTNGSPTMTMADTTGLVAGMYVSDKLANPFTAAGTYLPAGTKILQVNNGTTLTLDKNAIATGANIIVEYRDVVTINSNDFLYGKGSVAAADTVAEHVFDGDTFGVSADVETYVRWTALELAHIASRVLRTTMSVHAIDELVAPTGRLLIRETAHGGTQFVVSSTRPAAFSPTLGTTGLTATRDEAPGGVAFSKLDLPEAVPAVVNWLRLGDWARRRAARIFALRDALMVLTEGGVYRITGSAPDQWRVDLVDPSVYPLVPDACCVLDARIYALTNRGIVAIDEGGVELLSDPMIGDQLRNLQHTYAMGTLTQSTREGVWAVAHKRRRLVMFHFPATVAIGDSSGVGNCICYSPVTKAFTTRTTRVEGWRSAAYHERKDALYVGRGGAYWELRKERTAEQTAASCKDDTRAITIDSIGASSIQITGGNYVPAAGDVITQNGVRRHVTGVVGANVQMDSVAGLTVAAATAIEGMKATLDWQPVTGPAPAGAQHRELQAMLQDVATSAPTSLRMLFGGSTDRDSGVSTVTSTPAIGTIGKGRPFRAFLPREIARAAQLFPRVQIDEPETYWALAGIAVISEGVSERTVRT